MICFALLFPYLEDYFMESFITQLLVLVKVQIQLIKLEVSFVFFGEC